MKISETEKKIENEILALLMNGMISTKSIEN
jgi:hypothetical protein